MKPILEILKLGKRFSIRHQKSGYLSMRESLSNLLGGTKIEQEEFWALKDISFDVYPGDSVGILGRNGAGKSTLLKILSKITPPTEGNITLRGRIASLLEVGTGFHPELSGRENIFFNGSILGMKRKEIEKHFDAIVDFAGTENFLDVPLKHYSSGMQLRLAFAVAAFLEPEILVIDEVLAVGDAEFQKKCIGKMENVSKSGRTILFVSHNMEAIKSLCHKSIVINSGSLDFEGTVEDGVNHYLSAQNNHLKKLNKSKSQNGFELIECQLKTQLNQNQILNGENIEIIFFLLNKSCREFSTYMFLYRDESLAFISSDLHDPVCRKVKSEFFKISFTIPKYLLNPGLCRVGLMIADFNGNTQQYFNDMDILSFTVEDDLYRRGARYVQGWSGAVSPILEIKCAAL
jgi:lipopolysaccharide transport system ATP-binding protein